MINHLERPEEPFQPSPPNIPKERIRRNIDQLLARGLNLDVLLRVKLLFGEEFDKGYIIKSVVIIDNEKIYLPNQRITFRWPRVWEVRRKLLYEESEKLESSIQSDPIIEAIDTIKKSISPENGVTSLEVYFSYLINLIFQIRILAPNCKIDDKTLKEKLEEKIEEVLISKEGLLITQETTTKSLLKKHLKEIYNLLTKVDINKDIRNRKRRLYLATYLIHTLITLGLVDTEELKNDLSAKPGSIFNKEEINNLLNIIKEILIQEKEFVLRSFSEIIRSIEEGVWSQAMGDLGAYASFASLVKIFNSFLEPENRIEIPLDRIIWFLMEEVLKSLGDNLFLYFLDLLYSMTILSKEVVITDDGTIRLC